MKNKTIKFSDLGRGLSAGDVNFRILDADWDQITTKNNGVSDVLRLNLKLTDMEEPSKSMAIPNHLIFEDTSARSLFTQFFLEVQRVVDVEEMEVENLINLNGTVNLNYTPETKYPKLYNWRFISPPEDNRSALQEYIAEVSSQDSSELTEEDIDF